MAKESGEQFYVEILAKHGEVPWRQVLNDTLDGPSITASALLAAGGGFSYPSVFGLRAAAGECVRIRATSATFASSEGQATRTTLTRPRPPTFAPAVADGAASQVSLSGPLRDRLR